MYVLLLILVILIVASFPGWPYAANWRVGYYPFGGLLGVLIIVIIVLAVTGRL